MTFCLFLLIPVPTLAILSSVAIAGGSYFFVLGFRLLARQRSLLTTPTSKIRSIGRGFVEVSGVAAGPCTTLAPITEEPCFLYHTTAWRQRDGAENEWEKVADETMHVPFFIDDSTGQLLIEALGADLELHPRFRGEYAPTLLDSDDVPLTVSGFLSRHGIDLDRNLRIEERLIKSDDALFVAGTLMENPGIKARPFSPRSDVGTDPRNPVRDSVGDSVRDRDRKAVGNHGWRGPTRNHSPEPPPAPEIIKLASAAASSTQEMTQQAKIAAALNRASTGKPETWSLAGLPNATVAIEENAPATISARSEIRLPEVRLYEARPDKACLNDARLKESLRESRLQEARPNQAQSSSFDFDLAPPIILMKGSDDPTFVISFHSQKEAVTATTWKAAAIVCAGTAIALLGLYMLLL